MNNKRATKRALLTSVMALVMCVVMLVGTTFAWFTDTASTGVNKIQAGNLDIQLLMRKVADATTDTAGKIYYDNIGDSQEVIFGGENSLVAQNDNQNTIWEPGKTQVAYLAVRNAGNLALKYNIILNVEDGGLIGSLYYAIVPQRTLFGDNQTFTDTVESWDAVKADAAKLTTGTFTAAPNGCLDEIANGKTNETEYFALVVHMDENAGNTYMEKSVSIDMKVVATQAAAEFDSIDNEYDKDAAYVWDGMTADTSWYNDTGTEFSIANASELAGVSKLAAEGKTFKNEKLTLADNIDLDNEKWVPIKSFEGEFDGNGKTISGLKLDSTEGEKPRAGLFNGIEAGSKIHDLKIDGVEATVGKNGRVGVLGNYISGTVENIEIKNIKATATDPTAWVGGLCAFMSWPAVKDCTVENMEVSAPNGASFIAGFSPIMQKNANFTFENCNVKNFKVNVTDNSSDGCGVGGFVGQTQRGWEQPKMVNCHVTGIDIMANGNVQIGGFMPWPGGHTIAENCSVSGKIDATGVNENGYAGGFFGNLGWNCDLGQMGHQITNCTADVDITTKDAPAGGFVGTATNSNGNSMYAIFKGCKALGDVICVEGGTASIGGFAGVADRGYYEDCSASGAVSGGEVNGGFIGTVKHIDAKYDGRYPVGTREYEVEQITVKSCTGVSGLELIGKDDQSNKDTLRRYHAIIVE